MRNFMNIIGEAKTGPSFLKLLEGRNYPEMFERFFQFVERTTPDEVDEFRHEFTNQLSWARTNLKKSDRITWYLRHIRAAMAYGYMIDHRNSGHLADKIDSFKLSELVGIVDRYIRDTNENTDYFRQGYPSVVKGMRDSLLHYLHMPAPEIQSVSFGRETAMELWIKLDDIQHEYNKGADELVQPNDKDQIILQMGNYYWVKLDTHYCSEEARAMGHCGNGGSSNYDERILSLRQKIQRGSEWMWRPSLTFIIDQNGILGEMKGRGNDKPNAKYHPYIIALLKNPIIKGLRGGGYRPENNFSMNDLREEQREELYATKPTLMPLKEYYQKFGSDKFVQLSIEGALDDEGLEYKGITEDGKNIIIERFANWQDILYEYGDITDDHMDFGQSVNPDIETVLNDLPEAAIEKIKAHLRADYSDEVTEWEEDRDTELEDVNDLVSFMEDNECDVKDALVQAFYAGVQEGSQAAYDTALYNSLDEIGDDFDIIQQSNGYVITIGISTVVDMIASQSLPSNWHFNKISSPNGDFDEYSEEAAVQAYFESCPTGCGLNIPVLPPVSEMSPDAMRAEYEKIARVRSRYHFDNTMRVFDADLNRDSTLSATRLERARKAYWGVEQNPA